ncbi:inositol monophosphatase [Streptomyces sp. NBC_01728]|uniref:inositol monophosphatase family protein n=1 Tax=unclassified Streptomyces TaxID=2593676 RepID=UPI0022535F1C|nr:MULTISPECIES: inositol monophosphatase family protein [unclassified Streptomyces]MCX4461612.1 inositol monophosphatase [Streptomyces sp. NBC_01719]MCX4490520.1 inositol monophosphatase [Streptomyces sp. NBC_01728]MCX4597313.1 inositol monophosphatase [Streptomyces sp. NBC_01549]
MSDIDLLAPMTQAAQRVGDFLQAAPIPAPAATWGEFMQNFEALDKPAADQLRTHLSGLCPGAAWGEELGDTIPPHGEVWVIDAVDGAVQLLQDLPYWSISITLVRDLRPVATVLHSPLRGETYTAAAGQGSRRNGRLIRPSRKTDLKVALLATSQPPTVAAEPAAVRAAGRTLSAVLPYAGAVRNLGPTSWQVADTAAGRIDAFWEYGRDDANLLGGSLVAAEAGLQVTDTEGNPWQTGAASFLAAPAPLHEQLLALLTATQAGGDVGGSGLA